MNFAPVEKVPIPSTGVVKSAWTVWSSELVLPSVLRSVRSSIGMSVLPKRFLLSVVVGLAENR